MAEGVTLLSFELAFLQQIINRSHGGEEQRSIADHNAWQYARSASVLRACCTPLFHRELCGSDHRHKKHQREQTNAKNRNLVLRVGD